TWIGRSPLLVTSSLTVSRPRLSSISPATTLISPGIMHSLHGVKRLGGHHGVMTSRRVESLVAFRHPRHYGHGNAIDRGAGRRRAPNQDKQKENTRHGMG